MLDTVNWILAIDTKAAKYGIGIFDLLNFLLAFDNFNVDALFAACTPHGNFQTHILFQKISTAGGLRPPHCSGEPSVQRVDH